MDYIRVLPKNIIRVVKSNNPAAHNERRKCKPVETVVWGMALPYAWLQAHKWVQSMRDILKYPDVWMGQTGLDIDMSSANWLPVNTLTDQKDLLPSGDWEV